MIFSKEPNTTPNTKSKFWSSYETLESTGQMKLMMKFNLNSELWNLFSPVPTRNFFWCHSDILIVLLKHAQGFCPLNTGIARFPIGVRLDLSYKSLLRETAGKGRITSKSSTVNQKSLLHVRNEHPNSPSPFYTFLVETPIGDNWI